MPRRPRTRSRLIYAVAALGVLLRSLVAPGLMLVGAGGEFGLVLCPSQNPGLNSDLLSGSDGLPEPHQHGISTQQGSPSHEADDGGVVAESLNTDCSLWAGSAACAVTARPLVGDAGLITRTYLIDGRDTLAADLIQLSYAPRAPPLSV